MRLTFLGTCSSVPTSSRNVSSSVLSLPDGQLWMFDAGEGTQHQLRKTCLATGRISKLFITHMHGDHTFGIPGMICSIASSIHGRNDALKEKGEFDNNARRPPDLEIYGPPGLREFVRQSLILTASNITQTGFSYVVHELTPKNVHLQLAVKGQNNIKPDEEGIYTIYEDDSFLVQAGPLRHVVPCFGYVVKEKQKPGAMKVEKIEELKIPAGPIRKLIKASVGPLTLPDGRVINPEEFRSEPIPGRSVVILGDTSQSDRLLSIANGADLLVHEATLNDEDQANAMPRGHSTPSMAARFAAKCNVKTLALTHFSGAFQLDSALNFASSVKNIFKNPFFLAEDLMSVDIWPRGKVPPLRETDFLVTADSEEIYMKEVAEIFEKKAYDRNSKKNLARPPHTSPFLKRL